MSTGGRGRCEDEQTEANEVDEGGVERLRKYCLIRHCETRCCSTDGEDQKTGSCGYVKF